MKDFKRSMLIEATIKLLKTQSHFSICDFDNITKVAGIVVDKETRDILALAHCMDYGAMPDAMRKGLYETVINVLKQDAEFAAEFRSRVEDLYNPKSSKPLVVIDFPENKKTFMQRLLS